MSETLTERIKYIANVQPDHLMSAFASDLNEIVQRAESAEARAVAKSELIDSILATWEPMAERLVNAEAERDTFAAENDAVHRVVNEMCGTDTSTVEAVQHVIDQRDELARKLEQAHQEINELHTENGLKLKQIIDLEEILFSTHIIELNDGSPCWCIEDNHLNMCEHARKATEPFWNMVKETA